MKNRIIIFLALLIFLSACTATHVKKGSPDTKEKVSFKAREYFLKGLFLQTEERYSEAIGLFEQHLPKVAGGDIAAKRLAASAFSFFGLCVAMVNRNNDNRLSGDRK